MIILLAEQEVNNCTSSFVASTAVAKKEKNKVICRKANIRQNIGKDEKYFKNNDKDDPEKNTTVVIIVFLASSSFVIHSTLLLVLLPSKRLFTSSL